MSLLAIGPATRSDGSLALRRVAAEIGAGCGPAGEMNATRIVQALQQAVAVPDLIAESLARPDPNGYVRRVIHADPAGRFTILALTWGPGQASPAHAHRTWCAWSVWRGVLTETLFAFDTDAGNALAMGTEERRPGHGCFAPARPDRGHRLANMSAATAVSIHVYGVEASRIGTDVNTIFDCA